MSVVIRSLAISYTRETTVPVSARRLSISRHYDDLAMPRTRNRTFEPIALPQLAWSDALEATFLKIAPASHRATVALVYYAILRMNMRIAQSRQIVTGSKGGIHFVEEPDLMAPLFRIAQRVLDIVVIDDMKIFEVFRKRRICSVGSHFELFDMKVLQYENVRTVD